VANLKPLVAKYSAVAYFVLTFLISWGAVLVVIGGVRDIPGPAAQNSPLFPYVFVAMLAGPVVSSALLTLVIYGRAGARAMLGRLNPRRGDVRWYAVALLTAPTLVAGVLFGLSFYSREFLPALLTVPDKLPLLKLGLAAGLLAGIFEEIGWTGFVIPQMRQKFSLITTGLSVGLLWGAWHVLVVLWGLGDAAGSVPLLLFLVVDLFWCLPAYRVLMVWVYDHTESLLIAMLMHASLTTTMFLFGPAGITGQSLLVYQGLLGAAIWIVAGVVVLSDRRVGRAEFKHA